MRDWGLDLFDPRTAVMDLSSNSSPTGGSGPDFGFAFNDINFSDRMLLIEIVADALPESDWSARKSKRRRGDDVKKQDGEPVNSESTCSAILRPLGINNSAEEHMIDSQQPVAEDGVGDENHDDDDDDEEHLLINDSPSEDEDENDDDDDDDSNSTEDVSRILRVKTLHISSAILAAKSPFFYKLFSNGMIESEQRHVTLRINDSEEAAFMELLNFMYSNTLNISTAPALLDVLLAADKFEVVSCMRYCSRLLRNLPMTPESALLYLDLPSGILMAEAVQPLTDAAKQFLASRYKDITKYQDEVMNLPLAGIQAILSSDDLQVASEDNVYDLVLKWSRAHYPKMEERRNILSSHLSRHIRFPYMTCRKLKKLLACNDYDHDFATKAVLDALLFKADTPHRQRIIALEESTSTSRRSIERAYKYRPVKVIEFELPRQQCVVYLDLKREECINLFPTGRVYSQAFHLGGQGFFLSAHCSMEQHTASHCFGLFLGMQEKGSVSFAVDYEFGARSKPSEEFVVKYKGNYTFTGGKAVGYRNLFNIPWASFVADDSLYFINGVLHLRAELSIRR
ncbi:hypothetical protein ACS0TY_019243 [Phlomoides rotata]